MSTPEIDMLSYQRNADRECVREQAIANKSFELMSSGGDCDPHNGKNFFEAFLYADKADADEITSILAKDDFSYEELGKALYYIAFDYWDRESQDKAVDIVDGNY